MAESTSQQTARIMMTLFKAVVAYGGTAADAAVLHHPLGGKTGTTSDFNDAWFIGFSPSITCGVWVGYDSRQSLGEKESGGHAALPLWIDFMKVAIADHPDEHFPGDIRPLPPTNVASTHPAVRTTTTREVAPVSEALETEQTFRVADIREERASVGHLRSVDSSDAGLLLPSTLIRCR